MDAPKLSKFNFLPFYRSGRINKPLLLVVVLLLTSSVITTAYAAVGWGAATGPQWLNPGYQLNVVVTSMTQGSHNVCLEYSVDAVTTIAPCTCPGCTSAGVGTWQCVISSDYTSKTVAWVLAGYPNAQCNNERFAGPAGSFTTGPSSVVLETLTVESEKAVSFSRNSIVVIAAGIVFVLLGYLWRRRKGKHGK